MQIREYSLPQGWFPRDPAEIGRLVDGYLAGVSPPPAAACRAVIAPHAGWYFCGRLMALSCSSLKKDAGVVVVLGGHLGSQSPALFAMEDAVRTPLGAMPIDKELREELIGSLGGDFANGCAQDRDRDNTVEVLLPMVRHFFKQAKLVWLRLPAHIASFEAGKKIAFAAEKLKRDAVVIGSTDLTHYGRNYGFSPRGFGSAALRWVRDVNDAAFIKAVESGKPEEVLRRALDEFSSCSAGAVLGAMGFAKAEGLGGARLLEYATSAAVDGEEEPQSFVGYAAMGFN